MRSAPPLLVLACLAAFTAQAQTHIPPPATGAYGVEVAKFIETNALQEASGLTWAPDGSNRLFVVLKGGTVRVIQNGALLPTPFITEVVATDGEQGLQSLVFDPDFATNRYVYVFASQPNITVNGVVRYIAQILRFRDSGGVGVGRTVIVDNIPSGVTHNGGGLAFGPDGRLYFGVGDRGTSEGGNDDLSQMSSKILRVNKDGTIPTDNPFYDDWGPNHDLIWARGFRNPFRIRFQPGTGKLWANVAGEAAEQIFSVGRGEHGGWWQYENNQPAGFLAPLVAYTPGQWEEYGFTANGAVRKNGVATFTVSGTHPVSSLRKGKKVHLRDVRDPSFNGVGFITGFPSPLSFTVAQPGPDAVSGGGGLKTDPMGDAVVGGAFYAGTRFPSEYQGDYFFADFDGSVFRVDLGADGSVNKVDLVVNYSDWESFTDVAVGPDGALYVLSLGNIIYRVTPLPAGQGVVVSTQDLVVPEGGSKTLMVSLAMPPTTPTSVALVRREQDSDIRVSAGQPVLFDATNWSVPQFITLSAAQDADSEVDHATFFVTMAPGFPEGVPGVEIHARTEEDEVQALQLSTTSFDLDEGMGGTFTVRLTYAPTSPVTVTVARTSGSADVTVTGGASLTFTPEDGTSAKTVTVATVRDTDSEDDVALLTVSSPGLTSRVVTVIARDVLGVPAITSAPLTTATVGTPYAYTVTASGKPVASLTLLQGPQGMTLDPVSGRLSWTPAAEGTVTVSVRASNGQTPDAVQTFQIQVRAATVFDAGTSSDAGSAVDAGTQTDAGANADAGTGTDGGSGADAGVKQDGGTVTGPDEADSGGCSAGATALPGVLAWWLLAGVVWRPRRARR
ncbi:MULTISPECIES: PQQ-dependent sugar dehydrogenase [unclassified Corallococcus]|uniref:PQQ-dependent sugar dehydrogenase n=1 Tax=unclassified Corallococcus TaxID=2685029 RepID=UPI001A8F98D0|nr:MULTISPECIES: PQQ-dependent sugar dehydrogenase [unclassified Corallococcus]MBN9685134.1 PQQ-dependent sugar dehydrogenase [Corallococcus sp. NCSPR001]WAS83407.1 PQQ-dependent sugar dehydrogenase [Corallococcus sp. NCRR]